MKNLHVVLLVLLLAACASQPAPTTGPMLPKGPLHGRLDAGVYHDMRDWFAIATPLPPSDPNYHLLSVTEEYQANIGLVNFVPTQAPGEYYRAYVEDFYSSNHPVPDLHQLADSASKLFGGQLGRARAEPLRLVEEKPWDAGTTQGLLRLYTERAPIEPLLANLAMGEDYTAYMLMYVTTLKGKVAVLWAEWPMDCKPCVPFPPGPAAKDDDPIDQALALDGRAGTFMASFHFKTE